ncbi:MAG: bactofilin family protein, partial [Kiloniellales bacterium]
FHGSAVVKSCEVAGSFEGELTVSESLVVRNGGRVNGRINYGEIEIERGGRIGGAIELRDVAPRPLAFRSPTADTLARDLATRSKPGLAAAEGSEARGEGDARPPQPESAVS